MDRNLDVRAVALPERHPTIFRNLDELKTGESLTLINDHDPKPLSYQLQAERPEQFDWQYLQQGPKEWKVKITRR